MRESVADQTPRRRFRLPDSLAERFEYVRDIGAGAQAPVLLCADRESGEQVAVKLYYNGVVDREVLAALANGDPRRVVVPREYGTADGDPWEVMEYFELGTLEDVTRGGHLTGESFARASVVEIAAALEHLHDLDIRHRDLKPANIFVRQLEPLQLVVGDFGISIQSAGTVAATVRGTWAYAAPEAGSPLVKEEADWWAMGIIVHELLVGRHPLADDGGLLPSDNQVRASVFDGAVDATAVADPRWRMLLDGLLTWQTEARWGATQVREWLNGGSPVVARRNSPTMARPTKANVKPFPLAGVAHTDPAALAEAMVEHWDEAGDRLRGRGLADLRGFLADNGLDESSIRDITDRGRESYVLLAMQGAFLPGTPPHFRGRALDGASLSRAAQDAQREDRAAALWIRQLRTEGVLSEAARYAADGATLAVAADRLARWGEQIDAVAGDLANNVELAGVLESRQLRWEGALLLAALDDDASRALRDAGVQAAAAHGDVAQWATSLHTRANAIHASRSDDTATALIATDLLPAARRQESERLEAQRNAERERERIRREEEVAAARAVRVATLDARRRRAGAEFFTRLWLIVPYTLLAGFLSTMQFVFWDADWWGSAWFPMAVAGGSALLLSFGVFLWETYAGRVRLHARRRILLVAMAFVAVVWSLEHLSFVSPPWSTSPGWWILPAIVLGVAFVVTVVLARLFGPAEGVDGDAQADRQSMANLEAPRRLQTLAKWAFGFVVVAAVVAVGQVVVVLSPEGDAQEVVTLMAAPWAYDIGANLSNWLPALPAGTGGLGRLWVAFAIASFGFIATKLYRDIATRSSSVALIMLLVALVLALYVVVASPWQLVAMAVLGSFALVGIIVIGVIALIIGSIAG